jgi:hypothetical protein
MKWTSLLILIFSFSAFSQRQDTRFKLVTLAKDCSTPLMRSRHLFKNHFAVQAPFEHLKDHPCVKKVRPNFVRRSFLGDEHNPGFEIPFPQWGYRSFEDPKVKVQWAFRDPDKGGMGVHLAYASFPLPKEFPEVVVAVVDSGLDYTHEDLRLNLWINKKEIPGNGKDDDKNGIVDDIYGLNTLTRTKTGAPTGDPWMNHPHGTHVAGIIGATQNNKIGISGVAPVKIMGIKTVPAQGDETDLDVIDSFLYAAKMGASIINGSFGKAKSPDSSLVNEAIDYVGQTYGTLIVVASGNEEWDLEKRPSFPAVLPSDYLLVVAAHNFNESFTGYSNYGPRHVDILAPGTFIYSLWDQNRYSYSEGTSMAAPYVAGAAALLKIHAPKLGPLEIKQILMDYSVKWPAYKDKVGSSGRVDLTQALEYIYSL